MLNINLSYVKQNIFKSIILFKLNFIKFTFPFEDPSTEFKIKSGGAIASASVTASFFKLEHKSIMDPFTITDANGPLAYPPCK